VEGLLPEKQYFGPQIRHQLECKLKLRHFQPSPGQKPSGGNHECLECSFITASMRWVTGENITRKNGM